MESHPNSFRDPVVALLLGLVSLFAQQSFDYENRLRFSSLRMTGGLVVLYSFVRFREQQAAPLPVKCLFHINLLRRDVEDAIPYRTFKLLFFLILANSKSIDIKKQQTKQTTSGRGRRPRRPTPPQINSLNEQGLGRSHCGSQSERRAHTDCLSVK